MKSPVLFITYKRYDTAIKVFHSIKKAKPPKLYFVSNAPNPNHPTEKKMVAKVRSIAKKIDWPCELHKLFRKKHLGVKDSISSSISWFFGHETQGVILEDDCLPNQSFFIFCDILLDKFKTDRRVMMISGNNFQDGRAVGKASYYLSRLIHIWGWATWKRAWELYDINMTEWPKHKKLLTENIFNTIPEKNYWTRIFNNVYAKKIQTWDYQWVYTCWKYNGFSINPNCNLVSNIGFGTQATNTKNKFDLNANLKTFEIKLPLIHIKTFNYLNIPDIYTSRKYLQISPLKEFVKYFLNRTLLEINEEKL